MKREPQSFNQVPDAPGDPRALPCVLLFFFFSFSYSLSPSQVSRATVIDMSQSQRFYVRRLAIILVITCLCATASLLLRYTSYASRFTATPPLLLSQDTSGVPDKGLLGLTYGAKHPIELLVEEANAKFQILERQSTSFREAVTEYKRRYNRDPPQGFDRWYDAAVNSNAIVIDNFDTVMASLEPFWGLSAQELRARVQDLQELRESKIVSMSIKNQNLSLSNTQDVSANKYGAVIDWVQPYLQFLPDMEFLFSSLDEARVVVPRDELDNKMKICPKRPPSHDSSSIAQRVPIYFEDLIFQRIWMTTTLSCPVGSPARSGIIPPEHDGVFFVRNISLAKDSCEHPSAMELHGMFGTKGTARLLETLHPIFSRSKLSTYQDLLFPASDYAPNDHYKAFDASQDTPWEDKSNILYWAGRTTGAHAKKDSGWRKWQRHRFVKEMNDRNRTVSLLRQNTNQRGRWEAYEDHIESLSHLIDVSFTDTIHCDPEECEAMRKEMHFNKKKQSAEAVYRNRFVMDIDGNAFTERFYRLLMSKSKESHFLTDPFLASLIFPLSFIM